MHKRNYIGNRPKKIGPEGPISFASLRSEYSVSSNLYPVFIADDSFFEKSIAGTSGRRVYPITITRMVGPITLKGFFSLVQLVLVFFSVIQDFDFIHLWSFHECIDRFRNQCRVLEPLLRDQSEHFLRVFVADQLSSGTLPG